MTAIRPVAVGYYRASDRANLVSAIKSANLPKGTPVYVGTYGISPADAKAAHAIPGGKYAPLVTPQAKQYPARKLPAAQAAQVSHARAKYAGALPDLAKLTPSQRLEWGIEMGQRIRDQIRGAQAKGIRVDSFQLDEIWPEASAGGAQTAQSLPYLTGVLRGVRLGRPALGDAPMTGLVHIAQPAALARLPRDATFNKFLTELDATATQVVGETYPNFAGDPKAVAHAQMQAVRSLLGDGAHGRSLAQKYMVGLTPGNKPSVIAGRVPGQSTAQENAWRSSFMHELVREGAAGISEYNWTPTPGAPLSQTNADPGVMKEVFQEIARNLKG